MSLLLLTALTSLMTLICVVLSLSAATVRVRFDNRLDLMTSPDAEGNGSITDYSISAERLLTRQDTHSEYDITVGAQPDKNQSVHRLDLECFAESTVITRNHRAQIAIFTHSSPQNFKLRHAIRQTWGRDDVLHSYGALLYFVIGAPAEQFSSLHEYIKEESRRYGDVILLQFQDGYRTLTQKSLCMLQWTQRHCDDVKYVIKSDDDVYFNVSRLSAFLLNNDTIREFDVTGRHFMLGHVITGARRQVDRRNKYFTPEVIYQKSTYPPFLSGSAYIIPYRLVPRLLTTAQSRTSFWLEDVFLTGIVGRALNVSLLHNDLFVIAKNIGRYWFKRSYPFMSLHSVTYREMYHLYQNVPQ